MNPINSQFNPVHIAICYNEIHIGIDRRTDTEEIKILGHLKVTH